MWIYQSTQPRLNADQKTGEGVGTAMVDPGAGIVACMLDDEKGVHIDLYRYVVSISIYIYVCRYV